jgi:hypothetical protein
MRTHCLVGWIASSVCWLVLPSQRVSADDVALEPITLPAPFFEATPGAPPRVDAVLEASGVEPIEGGRLLLVAHDKNVPLRVVETATGRQVGPLLTSRRFPAETPKGPKWEGMARDADGFYYLVGSHSGKTQDERDQHTQLYRFRLKPGGAPDRPVAIDDASVARWRIAAPLVRALEQEGLGAKAVEQRKIEGLAIRELPAGSNGAGRELLIGLRQPDDLVRVFSADITKLPDQDAELPLRRLFAFKAGQCEGVPCQLTSLEYLPQWNGCLIVTATEDEQNAFHGNSLWFVPDSSIGPDGSALVEPVKVATFEVAMKAEGLCVLDPPRDDRGAGAVTLLVTYDNDAHSTHMPSRFQQFKLSRPTAAR